MQGAVTMESSTASAQSTEIPGLDTPAEGYWREWVTLPPVELGSWYESVTSLSFTNDASNTYCDMPCSSLRLARLRPPSGKSGDSPKAS